MAVTIVAMVAVVTHPRTGARILRVQCLSFLFATYLNLVTRKMRAPVLVVMVAPPVSSVHA